MKQILALSGEWQLSHRPIEKTDYAGRPMGNLISAMVPGDVHLDLMRHGDIADPVIRDNAAKCAWIGEHEWWYSKTFTGDFQSEVKHELVFDGLCYVADVWLNGDPIAHHLTMHRPLRVDISKNLKPSRDNLLVVRLLAFDDDLLEVPLMKWLTSWSEGISNKGHCLKRGASHKALYSFGWDWTQGLSICGIWRDVRIESTPLARLDNLYVKALVNGAVDLSFETISSIREIRVAKAVLVLREKASGRECSRTEKEIFLGPGHETYTLFAELIDPRLWWPAGMGEQFLYVAELTLEIGGMVADKAGADFGVRSVEIREGKISETQGTFTFVINGVPVFLKGANWIPPDIIPSRTTPDRYRMLLKQTVECGMNYLRFWGGGIYESSLFYEMCDELGIVIWQDMMFGGPEVPEFDPDYVEESKREVTHVVKSIRNHPSIAIWCGSNETDIMHAGVRKQDRPNGKYYGYRLLHDILPLIIGELDPTRAYLPSCPSLGKFCPQGVELDDYGFGTSHGNFANAYASDTELEAKKVPAFLNECYANSPDLECSLSKYLDEGDLDSWANPVFASHHIMDIQYSGEQTMFSGKLYHHNIGRFSDIPIREIFAAYHDNHCELVKRYTEFLRRRKDLCGGVAFWMLNSAYTMGDWSFIDYYCVPKPVFYAAKRANAEILPVIAVYDDRLDFHVTSDSRNDVCAELICEVRTFKGKTLLCEARNIKVKANVSGLYHSIKGYALAGIAPADCFVQISLKLESGAIIYNHSFLATPRELRLPVAKVDIKAVAGQAGVFTVSSDTFVRKVTLSPHDENNRPDDNFFDLLPGMVKTITFRSHLLLESVKLAWLNDAAHECLITSVAKSAETPEKWTCVVYNATDRKVSVPVDVRSTVACLLDFPDAVALEPGASVPVIISVGADLFKMDAGRQPVLPVDVHIGSASFLDSYILKRPFSFGTSGVFEMANVSNHLVTGGVMTLRGKTVSGVELNLETPPVVIPAKTSFAHDFKLPPDCIPYTCELWEGNRKLSSFWGGALSGDELWSRLPVRPFDGSPLKAFKTIHAVPDILSEGHGFLVESGMRNENIDWVDMCQGRAAVFLHYNAITLFVDILVRDIPLLQRFIDIEVYKDSCVELVFGYMDNSKYLDVSLALTQRGPELFMRKGYAGFTYGMVKQANLLVLDSPEDNLACYRYQFDLVDGGLPDLFKPGQFKMALAIKGINQARMVLFNGVVCGSGVEKAGSVELVI